MVFTGLQRTLGGLFLLFALALLPPAAFALIDGDGNALAFGASAGIVVGFGLLCWFPASRARRGLRVREGLAAVAVLWTAVALVAALPLLMTHSAGLSVTDAAFEAISGLTTTGASVLTGVGDLPRSLLLYRQELQWLGGLGIIVLAVAIVPLLGTGDLKTNRAGRAGPQEESRLAPRVADIAQVIGAVYTVMTALCALAYGLAGMGSFDAVAHALATVSLGGFSTHDAGLEFFESGAVEAVAMVFMLLGGTSFALHFRALRRRSMHPYADDSEFRAYLLVLAVTAAISIGYLALAQSFETLGVAVRAGAFEAVSMATTAGFTTSAYPAWPGFLPVMLLFASMIGASARSTGGGLKVIRVLLLFKQGRRELTRLVHPNARIAVKLGERALDDNVVQGVWAFFATYILCLALGVLLLMAAGHDQVTAFSATVACLNNLGPGLGEVAGDYAALDPFSKWVLSALMLLGRLEIFAFLMLLTPDFWRR